MTELQATSRPRRPRPKAVTLTDAAAERVREILDNAENDHIGLRIGVFHRDAQGVQRIQRVAHRFNAVFRAHQAQLKHEKRLFAKMKCWHPFPGASM